MEKLPVKHCPLAVRPCPPSGVAGEGGDRRVLESVADLRGSFLIGSAPRRLYLMCRFRTARGVSAQLSGCLG